MAVKSIEEQLKELLVERLFLDVLPEEIKDDVPLSEYGVDSFLLLELIVAIEEIFSVQFGQGDITTESLKTVAGLAAMIVDKKAE
ncbi:MAG: acyl carrier protein [Lentisphaeria bacterium]